MLSIRNTYRSAMFVARPATLFCAFFIVGTACAELKTTPPLVTPKEHQEPTPIEDLVAKARQAISENRLTTPQSNNAVFYVEHLLTLSPKDERAVSILREAIHAYSLLGYTRLGKSELDIAQTYHDKAVKIARKFNISSDHQTLADLQLQIRMSRQILNAAKPALETGSEASETAAIIEQKAQEKPLLLAEEQSPPQEIQISQRISQSSPEKQATSTKSSEKRKTPLSPEERKRIVVIINKRNKLPALTLRKLKSLYKGHQKTWPNGEAITLYLPPANSDEQLWLAQNVFQKKNPVAVTQFYLEAVIRNQFATIPATTTNGVADVSRFSGSIAIVKTGDIEEGDDSIKIVSIEGI